MNRTGTQFPDRVGRGRWACVLGGGILMYQWFVAAAAGGQPRTIDELEDEVWQKEQQIRGVRQDQKQLAKYKATEPAQQSRPGGSPTTSSTCRCCLRNSGPYGPRAGPAARASLKAASAQGKKAGTLTLPFTVGAIGDKAGVVKALATLKRRRSPIASRA